MTSWKEFYGGQYLTAEGLGKRKLTGKVLEVGPETISNSKTGGDSTKICLTLSNCEKKIALNKGNIEKLDKAWGEDYLKWKGRTVTVTTGWTTFNGEKTRGLVVTPIGARKGK